MNQTILIGRLTKDPEIKYISDSQTAVANFTLAVDRPMAKEKTADFIRITVFGKTAENCEKYLTKGLMVGIQGRIQTSSFKGKDGETKYQTAVIAERVEFLEWGDKTKSGEASTAERAQMAIPEGFSELDEDDDQIPF